MAKGSGGGGRGGRGAIRVKRVHFKFDHPASEKQKAYLRSLLQRAQKDWQEDIPTLEPPVLRKTVADIIRHVNANELPSDLTSWEASKLIDNLRYRTPYSRSVVNSLITAVKSRISGKKATSAEGHYSWLAFEKAASKTAQLVQRKQSK